MVRFAGKITVGLVQHLYIRTWCIYVIKKHSVVYIRIVQNCLFIFKNIFSNIHTHSKLYKFINSNLLQILLFMGYFGSFVFLFSFVFSVGFIINIAPSH